MAQFSAGFLLNVSTGSAADRRFSGESMPMQSIRESRACDLTAWKLLGRID